VRATSVERAASQPVLSTRLPAAGAPAAAISPDRLLGRRMPQSEGNGLVCW
jgi:hypothetical protein